MTQKRLLDHHCLYHCWLVLSYYRIAGIDMHDWSGGYKYQKGTLVVRECMSAWQYVRQTAVEVFAPPSNP